MQGTISGSGMCALYWDLRREKFYSPDGTKHCLPCEQCGEPQWVELKTNSVTCEYCVKVASEGLGV